MIDNFDLVNGLFELFGGVFNLINVRRIYIDKSIRGVSILPTAFFSAWGIWNLLYYPHLSQWMSFIGGIGVVGSNLIWVTMAVYYTYKKPRE